MKRFLKSIRWRLQLWYGFILVVVLAGFGVTAYRLERGRRLRSIDDDLEHRASALAGAMHRPPGRGPPGRSFDGGPPEGPHDRPPGEFSPDHDGPTSAGFHLPPVLVAMFEENNPNQAYFLAFSRHGDEMARSTNAPTPLMAAEIYRSLDRNEFGPPGRPGPGQRPPPRNRGQFRELIDITPPGDVIIVGCSMAAELGQLRVTALELTAVGAVILLFGVAGGWWMVTRAIRPIDDISAAAVKISAGDLSQRIGAADAENELGRLAGVLNSTFARLESAFAQQKQFASDAAHELRTPVTVMLTQTQMALNRERSGADYRETIEACQRAAQRMRRLIESLLELTRLDAGQEPMRRARFDLARVVRDCAEQLQPLAAEHGVTIHCDPPPLECDGDSDRLAQVVTNLLTNAIRHNRRGGEVRATLELSSGLVILAVADTGPGISPADLPRVFERFYRGDKSRTGVSSGLGLAISKAIVEAHGGTIEVTSTENTGTVFTVSLPNS